MSAPNPASVREETRLESLAETWREGRPSGWVEWSLTAIVLLNVLLGALDRNVPSAIGWSLVLVVTFERNLERTNGRDWKRIAQDWRRLAEGWHYRAVVSRDATRESG